MRNVRLRRLVLAGLMGLWCGLIGGGPFVAAQQHESSNDRSRQEAILTDIEEVVGDVERFLKEEEKQTFDIPEETPVHDPSLMENGARTPADRMSEQDELILPNRPEETKETDETVEDTESLGAGDEIDTVFVDGLVSEKGVRAQQPWWRRWFGSKKKPSSSAQSDQQRLSSQEYWEEDIKDQTLEGLRRNQRFKEVYEEAKRFEVPKPAKEETPEEPPPVILTTSEILQRVIPEDRLKQKIDLEFNDAKLGEILMTLGDAGGLNIVLDPSLHDKPFNLYLKGVTLEEALKLIADAYDLGFKPVGTSLFITEKEKLKSENLTSRIIKLRNLNVQEAKALVEDMVQVINVSEEINSLVVIDEPEKVAEVEQMLKRIDSPQPQVILEAKIIELNKDALKDLGVDWSDTVNILYQESGRPVDFDDPEDASRGVFEIAKLQRNALQFTTVLRMLENQNKAKVLATPKITTLNNKEAEIFVGDRVPYTVTTISGGVATTDVRFEEPGIRLKITPSIIDKDFVVLKVEPEVSFIFTFRGPNDEFPQTRIRKATAYVRVKNGQPFVLGGLLNQEDKKNLYKVPMIGDLPLIGNLFKYEKDTLVDTELLITIVPTIVYGDV